MRVLAVTLARQGSRGILRKNIVPCAGKPLIEWTFDAARESGLPYVVVSDDIGVLTLAHLRDIDFIVESPDLPECTSDEALRWAVEQLEGPRIDVIVELMATNPLKTADDIHACLDLLVESGADSVIAVAPLDGHHPARAKRIVDGCIVDWCEHCAETSTQRQHLSPPAYIRASAIYAMTREALFSVGRFGHAHSLAYVLPPERGVGIDTPADLAAAEWYLRERSKE